MSDRRSFASRFGLPALLTVAMAATLGAGTAAANAVPAPRQVPAAAALHLTVTAGVHINVRLLTCAPIGGSHPKATMACRQLQRVNGDIDLLADTSLACTTEYEPVLAAANGHWYGRPVNWQRVFGNSCELTAATGAVFEFET